MKKNLDKYVITNFVFVMSFIVTMIIIFCIKGSIPDALVDLVKYVCSAEFVGLSWIKTTKTKHKKEDNNEGDSC